MRNKNPDGKPVITKTLKEQILAVRDTGKTNMFDVYAVQRIANELDLFELVDFLAASKNHKTYCEFILHGKTQ